MFIPSKDKLINLDDVRTVSINDPKRGDTLIRLKDGTYHESNLDLDSIESMACPTIKAEPGYARLFYGFMDQGFIEHPIIAWRIHSPYGIEPISFCDNDLPWPGIDAVRYPDGRVIVNDEDGAVTLDSMEEWTDYAKQSREELSQLEEEK